LFGQKGAFFKVFEQLTFHLLKSNMLCLASSSATFCFIFYFNGYSKAIRSARTSAMYSDETKIIVTGLGSQKV
jgi:hypothetical protein